MVLNIFTGQKNWANQNAMVGFKISFYFSTKDKNHGVFYLVAAGLGIIWAEADSYPDLAAHCCIKRVFQGVSKFWRSLPEIWAYY